MKLILTDIDGTILPRGQARVSDRCLAAIHEALDAGLSVGPATGRALPAVMPTFGGDADCVRTCLAINGMQVYLDGRLIHEELLPREALVRVAELLRDVPHAGLICFKDGSEVHLVEGDVADLAVSFPSYATSPVYDDAVPDFPMVKANVFCARDDAATRELLGMLSAEVGELGFNMPMSGFLNITPPGYSKATGIDIMCEALGVGLDEVVVFGDAGNDLEMLSHVPNSVAVANATDEVKACARWHIGECADDAVAEAISALARGEFPFTA